VFYRFYEPKLLDAATKVKICSSDSLFVRYKTQIAMPNNKKLIESREDTLAQQETGSLSWLRTVAPIFPVNGSKVIIHIHIHVTKSECIISTKMLLSTDYYNSQATNVLHYSVGKVRASQKENYICLVIFGYRSFRN